MKRTPLLLAPFLISLNAFSAQSTPGAAPLTQTKLGDKPVQLSESKGRCVLTREGNAPVTLEMKWPCRFSEDRQQKVRVEPFREALIIMVERSEPQVPLGMDCKTDLQPVRLYKDKLQAAPVSHIAACGPGFWDQKVYTWLFDW